MLHLISVFKTEIGKKNKNGIAEATLGLALIRNKNIEIFLSQHYDRVTGREINLSSVN